MEIEMFFARYDIDGDRLLQPNEIKRMLADLEGKRNETESENIINIILGKCVTKMRKSLILLKENVLDFLIGSLLIEYI